MQYHQLLAFFSAMPRDLQSLMGNAAVHVPGGRGGDVNQTRDGGRGDGNWMDGCVDGLHFVRKIC